MCQLKPTASPLAILAPLIALLFGVGLLLGGHGLQTTLVPLRGELEDFSSLSLGLIGSSFYAGFVVGCLVAPRLVVQAGHIRVFAALVSLYSAVALGPVLLVDASFWVALRFLAGIAMAGLYMIIESWLNEKASNQTRGLIMSAYIVVNFSAITAGQMLITLADARGFILFSLASVLVSLAAVPVALTRSSQPAPIALVSFRPRALFDTSPVGIVGVFMIGIANSAFWGLGPVFAARANLGADGAAWFMSAAVIGAAVMQYPFGRLSDHVDRRLILSLMLLAGAGAGAFLFMFGDTAWMVLSLAFLFGALSLPGYSLAAAHAYDHTSPNGYVDMAAGLLLFNGLGSIIGPFLAAPVMERFGNGALFVFTAGAQTLLALYVFWRMNTRPAVAQADKTDFDLGATAPVGGAITPTVPDPEDEAIVLGTR